MEYDGELACVAGVTIRRTGLVFFSDIVGGPYPAVTIFKVACWIVERVAEMNKPVMAIGDDSSHNFLTRLGFLYCGTYFGQRYYKL